MLLLLKQVFKGCSPPFLFFFSEIRQRGCTGLIKNLHKNVGCFIHSKDLEPAHFQDESLGSMKERMFQNQQILSKSKYAQKKKSVLFFVLKGTPLTAKCAQRGRCYKGSSARPGRLSGVPTATDSGEGPHPFPLSNQNRRRKERPHTCTMLGCILCDVIKDSTSLYEVSLDSKQ